MKIAGLMAPGSRIQRPSALVDWLYAGSLARLRIRQNSPVTRRNVACSNSPKSRKISLWDWPQVIAGAELGPAGKRGWGRAFTGYGQPEKQANIQLWIAYSNPAIGRWLGRHQSGAARQHRQCHPCQQL